MPKNRKSAKTSKSVNKAKAKLRGVFGAARSSATFSPTSARNIDANGRRSRFAFALASGLTQARGEVPVNSYSALLDWMEQQKSVLLPANLRTAKPTLASLSHVHKTKPISLMSEIYWLCARMCSPQEKSTIKTFISIRNRVEAYFWQGDYPSIQTALAEMEKELGQSVWLVETKLSIEQMFRGLESQKRLLEKTKLEAGRGFIRFLCHRMSMRNEPAVTTSRFTANLENYISSRKLEETMAEYLRYKLSHKLPSEHEKLAAVLRFLQNHSTIDLYEGLIALFSQAGQFKQTDALLGLGLKALIGFAEIDTRLKKIHTLSMDSLPSGTERSDTGALELLISGNLADAYKLAGIRFREAGHRDIFQLYIKAQSGSFTELPPILVKRGPPSAYFPRLLSHVISRSKHAARAYNLLDSSLRNLHVFPTCKAFADIAQKEHDPLAARGDKRRHGFALNNQFLSPLELPIHLSESFFALQSYAVKTKEFYGLVSGLESSSDRISRDVKNIGAAFSEYHRANASKFLMSLGSISDPDIINWMTVRSLPVVIDAHVSIGDLSQAINLAATAMVVNSVPASVLPLASIISADAKWPDLRQYAADISLSIVLDQCYKTKPSDSLAALRRTAVDVFVRTNDLAGPSQAADLDYEQQKIIYFLKNLCISSILDMCRCIKGTKAVQEERRKVLAALIILDPPNSQSYENEILLISSNLRIREGLRVVDGSRVHVDEEGIARWAHSELQESITRYKSLVGAGVGVASNLDELIKEYATQTGSMGILEVPKNEADDLLVATLWQLRDRFIYDKPHGLNSYLSKRVRHNSIAGYLRGALEAEHLITSLLGGKYIKNSYWIDRFKSYGFSNSEVDSLIICLQNFGVKFDNLTNQLKNSVLHIKSIENPAGIIDLPLMVNVVHLARSTLQSNSYDMGSLLDLCFASFWRTLEPSLLRVRDLFRHEQKNKFLQLFEDLSADTIKIVGRDRQCHELTTAITNASVDLQRLMDRAADWFFKRQGLLSKYSYSLDEIIDVSIEAATARHKGCRISVEKDVRSTTQFRADSLSAVADIFLVVVGNISEHSGRQNNAALKIFAHENSANNVIRMRFESPTTAALYEKNSAGVAAAKAEIARGTYLEKSSKDSNSGLCKVASIVMLNSAGRIDFGFVNREDFYLDIDLPMEFQSIIVPDSILEEK